MLTKPVIYDGQLQRQSIQGDVVGASIGPIPATNATAGITITGADMLKQVILRSAGGAMTDTIDTAANIITALNAAANGAIQAPFAFNMRWIVTTAFAATLTATANTGITVTRGVVAATSAKDFLVTLTNTTPAQVYACTTTNGSAVVGMTPAQAATLSVGMIVTNAVANLQGQTIIAVNSSSGQVTLSGNANATNGAPGVAINFSPTILIEGLAP